MSGVSLTVDTRGLDRLAKRFRRLHDRARDLFPLFDEIGAALVSSTQRRFEEGRGPDGEAWPESFRAREEGGKTLVDRAHLLGSITHNAGRESVEVGSNLIYAAIHQTGGEIAARVAEYLHFRVGGRWARVKSVTIPARPYLGLSPADEDEIGAIVEDHLMEPLR